MSGEFFISAVEELISSSDEEDSVWFWPVRNSRTRIDEYVAAIVPLYSDAEFRSHFRCSRSCVENLLAEITPVWDVRGRFGREHIGVHKSILIFLWTVGNQESIRSVSDRFGVALSTVVVMNRKVCEAILDVLMPKYVKFETDSSIAEVESLRIVGAIDGSHIPISAPSNCPEDYINRKGFHSVLLQAVCNGKMAFINLECEYPGSMHDARVFHKSKLKTILSSTCRPQDIILADSAYPLTRNVITPFRDNGHLTEDQRRFNYQHSSHRMVIERTFGVLKARFRALKLVHKWRLKDTIDTILSACVLHNVFQHDRDVWEELLAEDLTLPTPNLTAFPSREEGVRNRDRLMHAWL